MDGDADTHLVACQIKISLAFYGVLARFISKRNQNQMETCVNILAMLQTLIAADVVLLVGMWALYAWLKHTGQLSDGRHSRKP